MKGRMSGTGFFWILAACAAYGVLHSLLASRQVKAAAARLIGHPLYHRGYRLFYAITGAVTALPLLALAALLPDRTLYTIPAPWVYLTGLVQLAALGMLALGVLQTGAMRFIGLEQALRPRPQDRANENERLVVDGLYRWVRHPLYTTAFLFLWLAPVMTVNLLALNLGLSAYMWIGSIFEERKLLEQFGEAYALYRRQTPRIIPWPRKRQSPS
jgi:protein-S-isoprenylcysteine O-methyltransferase Ste14